jgi:hypothetical protein
MREPYEHKRYAAQAAVPAAGGGSAPAGRL